jgi:hypothetical protein
MRTLQATPPRHTAQPNVHVSDSLASATHVFIWRDAVTNPLQQPYDGPYRVVKRTDKFYINGPPGHHVI